jgi:hypothetical protein
MALKSKGNHSWLSMQGCAIEREREREREREPKISNA